jgi:hypothetical protein
MLWRWLGAGVRVRERWNRREMFLLSFVVGVLISVMRNAKLILKYVINYDIN